jgi:hypothetical protein
LTRIKYVDLQKCYPVELGEAFPWCCVLRLPAARDKGLEELRWVKAQQSCRFPAPSTTPTHEAWAFAHLSDQTRRGIHIYPLSVSIEGIEIVMTNKGNAAPAETVQSKNERREAEIALAMKQEAERRAAAVRNMYRLRALRLSRVNQQVAKTEK